MNIVVSLLSSFLWRVRGGLRILGKKIPLNKIWYAIFFAYLFCEDWKTFLVYFIACYTSYQLYGWGRYIGALCSGGKVSEEKECELIDDLLDNCRITWKGKVYKLIDYPRLYGFLGTSLTGLIITFLWGLALNNLGLMQAGIGMGVCYWLGTLLEKIYPLGKSGWNWGEWIFGAYMGAWLGSLL